MHTATIIVPAQNFNQDVLGDIAKGWNQFVSSGQIWALLIGLVIGYMVKSITSS
jgi:Na+/citrate or Na+/malate symporter